MTIVTAQQLLADARAKIRHITPVEALALHDQPEFAFVDVRERHELESGMIPGAVHATRGNLEFYLDPRSEFHLPELTRAKTLIFVCGSGGRSAFATRLAQDFGYDALCLEGGMKAWTAAGGPVT